MKTYTPWTVADSRIIVASDRTFRAPEKWEGRVKIECDLFAEYLGMFAWGDENNIHACDRERLPLSCDERGINKDRGGCWVTPRVLRREVFKVIDRSQAMFMAVTKETGRVRELWDYYTHGAKSPFAPTSYEQGSPRLKARPNLHLFAECHNQATVDARVPELLKCRDLSPSLGIWFRGLEGEVNLRRWLCPRCGGDNEYLGAFGESMEVCDHDIDVRTLGYEACGPIPIVVIEGTDQPLHPSWVRSLRDQCLAAGCKFVFLGWGDWVPAEIRTPSEFMAMEHKQWTWLDRNGESGFTFGTKDRACMVKVGRAASGRLLDGREWGWE